MDDVTLARAVHVVAVVHWIGGLTFVTAVILPAISTIADPLRRLELFEAIEHRFSAQVKVSVVAAGLSGAYMAMRLDIWDRFMSLSDWWLGGMAIVWLVFMAILFVIEPFVLRGWLRRYTAAAPAGAFRAVQRAHIALLAASMVTVASAVLGAHGFFS